jgi:hypothetical protein
MKKLIMIALFGALFSCSMFSFYFTDIGQHPAGKIVLGGYFLLMAYQIISPYPLVFEADLGQTIGGMNFGPFIIIHSEASEEMKIKWIAHEREHLYQNAVTSIFGFSIFYTLEGIKAVMQGYNFYSEHNWFEGLAYGIESRFDGENTITYISLKLEF